MNILITGAAGSIGSELVRKLIGQGHLILFDINELGLYELDLELREDYNFTDFSLYLGNVCNPDDVNFVYAKFKPEIIFWEFGYDATKGDYGSKGLSPDCHTRIARIVARAADGVCQGRAVAILCGGSRRDIARYCIPKIINCLAL